MEAFSELVSGNFLLDVDEVSSVVATELDSQATSEAETISGQILFRHSPDVMMLISDSEVENETSEAETIPGEIPFRLSSDVEMENEAVENEVVEVVDLISRTSSEVEFVSEDFVDSLLTPEQELERMRSEEKWGYLTRIQDRQSAVQSRVSWVCQEVQSLSYEARRLRRISFAQAVHGEYFAATQGSSATSHPQPDQHLQPRQSQLEPDSGTF